MPSSMSHEPLGRYVASYRNGFGRRPAGLEDGPVVLRIADTSSGTISLSSPRRVAMSEWERSIYDLRRGDLLFVRVNGSASLVGRCILVDVDTKDLSFNDHLIRVRLQGEIDPAYVRLICDAPQIRKVIVDKASTSAGQLTVNQDILGNLDIPLPPLPEQKRIAAILTEQITAINCARAATQAQLNAARALRSVYIDQIFNRVLAKSWPIRPLGQVGQIGSGITLGRPVRESQSISVPYLRVANVKDGHLDLTSVLTIEATESEIIKCKLQYGDLLLTEGGDPDKLGRGTFWQEELPLCVHQNHIFRVRFDLDVFSPEFLSAQIGSPYGKAYFLTHAKQTTGIATINQKVLANFPLVVPPIDEQRRVAQELDQKTHTTATAIQVLQAQLDAINQLPAALLRRAFGGELLARPAAVAVPTSTLPAGTTEEQRAAILAYIIHYNRDKPDLYRTILAKDLYLSEAHAGVPKGGEYLRLAAGPFATDLSRLERVAAEQKWFRKLGHKRNGRDMVWSYRPGAKIAEALGTAKSIAGDSLATLNNLLDLLASQNTWHTEMIATLFAAWNDFVLEGNEPTEEQIVREVRENWHPKKEKFSPGSLHEKLAWMREHDLVPRGLGPHTKSASEPTRDGSL